MRVSLVLAAGLAVLAGSALLVVAAYAADPAKPYLGMTKEAILACAGEPYAKYRSGADAETLTYHYSGAGPVPAPPGQKKKKQGGLAGFFPGGDKADKEGKKDKSDQNEPADTSAAAAASETADQSETAAKGETADQSETAAKGGKGGKGGRGGKGHKRKDSGWTCTASLVFEHGLLTQVIFAHKDVRGAYDWQREKDPKKREALRNAPLPTCTFSLPNCTPR